MNQIDVLVEMYSVRKKMLQFNEIHGKTFHYQFVGECVAVACGKFESCNTLTLEVFGVSPTEDKEDLKSNNTVTVENSRTSGAWLLAIGLGIPGVGEARIRKDIEKLLSIEDIDSFYSRAVMGKTSTDICLSFIKLLNSIRLYYKKS